MKKLIAIAVLFVGITAAVLAQDEGKWKVGFSARYVSDLLYATSVKEKFVFNPLSGEALTYEYGNYNKGTINFFGNTQKIPSGDQRLLLSLSNSGENYDVYVDIKKDGWIRDWSGGVYEFLQNGSADWHASGTAGIFNAQIGSAGYGGFVGTFGTWSDWIGWNNLGRFGVWRGNDAENDFYVGDDFRTWSQWGNIFAIGATFADNYKFSIGYRINPGFAPWNWGAWAPNDGNPYESKSSINASFMFSGRPVDGITFDLFYSVLGKDDDTLERNKPVTGQNYAPPTAKWENIIGVYVGLNIIDNLGISLGYTVNFNAWEEGGWWDNTRTVNRAITYKAPIYSGIDLHLSYNGIDKVPLTFNNNFTFAGIKGEKNDADAPGDYSTLVFGHGEKSLLSEGHSEDWFHWNGELKVGLGFIDGVNLTLHLGDQLGAVTKTYINPDVDGRTSTQSSMSGGDNPLMKNVRVELQNEFRVSLFAEHGVGAVTVGTGLFFSLKSNLVTLDGTFKDGVGSEKGTYSTDVVTFGIPILFKVAF